MIRLKGIDSKCKRKLLLVTLLACLLSIFAATNVTADFEGTMYWKDYNGVAVPNGYMPDIDQNQDFDKVLVRTEETSQNVVCDQNWEPYTDGQASGGGIKYSDTVGSTCTFILEVAGFV